MNTTNRHVTPGITDGRLVDEFTTSTLLSAEDFKAAFRNHPAGVAVITADPGDGPVALTATSVFSVSATPPLLVFSVSELSSAAPAIARSTSVVVHCSVPLSSISPACVPPVAWIGSPAPGRGNG